MGDFSLKYRGFQDFAHWLVYFPEQLIYPAARAVMQTEANMLLRASNDRVPIDEGDLKKSGSVKFVRRTMDKIAYQVVYTDPGAVPTHENPRSGKTGGVGPSGQKYAHWATTGEWKFLEKAAMIRRRGMEKRLESQLRGLIEKKV